MTDLPIARRASLAACALVAAGVLAAGTAHARRLGIAADDCAGCHSGGRAANVRITATPVNPSPGVLVTLRISIDAVNGTTGGFDLRSSGPGAFQTVAGQNTRLVTEDEMVHSAPGTAVNGTVNFELRWLTPATPGGTDFDVAALSANNNNASSGDGAGRARLNLVYGCAGVMYYRDFDGDGYGAETSGTTRNCEPPMGYAVRGGDCNDNDERAFPGAPESCDTVDNDCDGMTDENVVVMAYYPDGDGDGHGGRTGTAMMGCRAPLGYGAGNDDCNDTDRTVYVGAREVCDNRDNDCDGRVDEGARAVCGVGWCARAAPSCDPTQCIPGQALRETCNAFDDDCDGVVDNGAELCIAGQACSRGMCVPAASVPDSGAGENDAGAGADDAGAGDDAETLLPDGARADGATVRGPRGSVVGCICAAGAPAATRPRGPGAAAGVLLGALLAASGARGRRRPGTSRRTGGPL